MYNGKYVIITTIRSQKYIGNNVKLSIISCVRELHYLLFSLSYTSDGQN